MPFSHHSHSGQFCPGHAKDMLEDIILTAIAKKMQVFALTEHMPRHDDDRYPEESGAHSILETGFENQTKYYWEAIRLRAKYGEQLQMPIGFEIDYCRPESLQLIEKTLASHQYDFFVGSLHHVNTIPIDYDRQLYMQARRLAGGTDEKLFERFFDEQLAMLQKLEPPVVGHFDLIRLMSDEPNGSFKSMPTVWERIQKNLEFVASYGGILEINCASLRKGMTEPYPKVEIAKEFVKLGGRFCLSDDSHGIAQVALNYHAVLPYMEQVDITSLRFFGHLKDNPVIMDKRFPHLTMSDITVDKLKAHPFWQS